MARYRIYVLDPSERVERLVEDEMESDAVAGCAAERLRGEGWAVEVWRGEHLIARSGEAFRPFEPTPSARRDQGRV